MSCVAGCLCRCGQHGCGCHITQPGRMAPRVGPRCSACSALQVTREVGGKPVSLCPACDLGHSLPAKGKR